MKIVLGTLGIITLVLVSFFSVKQINIVEENSSLVYMSYTDNQFTSSLNVKSFY